MVADVGVHVEAGEVFELFVLGLEPFVAGELEDGEVQCEVGVDDGGLAVAGHGRF